LPDEGSIWYTVCGVAFTNRVEYIAIIGTISLVAAIVMYNAHFRSSPDGLKPAKHDKKSAVKSKKNK